MTIIIIRKGPSSSHPPTGGSLPWHRAKMVPQADDRPMASEEIILSSRFGGRALAWGWSYTGQDRGGP